MTSRPHGLRHGVAKLERIVDDDQVSPEPGERPVDRGCDAFAPLRGRDLAVGVAIEPHGGEGRSIEGIINHAAEVVRVVAGENIGIRDHDHPFPGVMSEEPCRQGHGCA